MILLMFGPPAVVIYWVGFARKTLAAGALAATASTLIIPVISMTVFSYPAIMKWKEITPSQGTAAVHSMYALEILHALLLVGLFAFASRRSWEKTLIVGAASIYDAFMMWLMTFGLLS